jgi:hypothetical protein
MRRNGKAAKDTWETGCLLFCCNDLEQMYFTPYENNTLPSHSLILDFAILG